ncbi:MAG: 30S ribosomal protein S9 [Fidelibacterota bacterium]
MTKAVFIGIGRRKSSVARVRVTPGKGKILVNGRDFKQYLCRDTLATVVTQPLHTVEAIDKYDISVNVNGGGLTGQAGAIRLGIARALLQVDSDHRPSLKAAGFLVRDARKVERKKYGQPGARKRFQFSKR